MNAILLANIQPVMLYAEYQRMNKQQAIQSLQPIEGTVAHQYLTLIFQHGAIASSKLREGHPCINATMPAEVLRKYVESGYITCEQKGGNRGGIWRPAKGVTPNMLNINLTEH